MISRTLIYTIAVDDEGCYVYRNLAKLLASSVVRSGFSGEMVIFHNARQPIFPLGRSSVREERIDVSQSASHAGQMTISKIEARWSLKHQVSSILHRDYDWQRLLFLDADCLVTGPLSSLVEGEWELAVYREPGQTVNSDQFNCFLTDDEMNNLTSEGINSGAFCVDRSVSEAFFRAWASAERLPPQRRRTCSDQASLNRVVLDHDFQLHEFSAFVSMPFHTDTTKRFGTVVTHWVGGSEMRKLQASFGLFMETYFFDPSVTLFNLLES